MGKMEQKPWYADYYRSTDDEAFIPMHFFKDFVFQHRLRYMVYFRTAQKTKSRLRRLYCEYKLLRLCRKYGIELKTQTKVGKGFVMTHPYNITVSPMAVIGENCTMLKGSSIGAASGGKKAGAPTLGDRVYVGLNSTVIGGITVGSDVLIAPNTFVNVDVPDHSIVMGSPCQVIPRENATAAYIWKILK